MGTRKRSAWAQLFWVVCFFAVIMFGVWRGYDIHNYDWFYGLILMGMAGLSGFYSDGLRKLGFWPKNFKNCFLEYGKKLLILAGLIFFLGLWFGTVRYTAPSLILLNLSYGVMWGFLQQCILNGFFVNRLAGFFENENNAGIKWGAGGLFALAHMPNWFLMAVTFFGGWVCAKIYLKHRNLYFLGLAHAIIALLLYLFVPDSIGHHLVVGPEYFKN
ncbi:MAG: CPBP family intramembrane metalloprotease [Candidatus Yanofskybacteria bacterium]|nr:CPBP family intramembrane metalloprotease [Candidatus Yanofskybacteria bacterium]